jgi:hypothetical protein
MCVKLVDCGLEGNYGTIKPLQWAQEQQWIGEKRGEGGYKNN